MKHLLFVYTGTGNSLFAAKQVGAELGEHTILPMYSKTPILFNLEEVASVGFFFPVFYMDAPSVVKNFVASLQFNKGEETAYFYSGVTCGRLHGNALATLGELFTQKGRTLHYGQRIIAPDSIPFPERGKEKNKEIHKQNRAFIQNINELKQAVREKKTKPQEKRNLLLSVYHKFRNKNTPYFDCNFQVTDKCTGCGVCEKVCGMRNICTENTDNRPEFSHNCSACMACFHYCSYNAIFYKGKDQKWFHYKHPQITVKERASFFEKS